MNIEILKKIHIISRDKGWAVKKDGISKAIKIYINKESAIRKAKKIALNGQVIVVHKKDGSVQKWEEK